MALPATTNQTGKFAKLLPLRGKQAAWLKSYLDENNPNTFMNRAGSAKHVKYKAGSYEAFCQIGYENYIKLEPYIEKWLDEFGLSENRLKLKVISLTEAKETKFFQKDGIVTDTREVEALEIQRRSLDMALKVKGLYASESRDVNINIMNILQQAHERRRS